MADQTDAQAKLVQYLTEAYSKEKELETALTAHIGMATRPSYKKRLEQHLKETRQHAKLTERRLKKLGGSVGVVGKAGGLASRGVAPRRDRCTRSAVPGRRRCSSRSEDRYSEEHEEIAQYLAIETLATEVGDDETAKLATADPSRRGADGRLPRATDPGLDPRGRACGDPRIGAEVEPDITAAVASLEAARR